MSYVQSIFVRPFNEFMIQYFHQFKTQKISFTQNNMKCKTTNLFKISEIISAIYIRNKKLTEDLKIICVFLNSLNNSPLL